MTSEFDLERFIQNVIETVWWVRHHLNEENDHAVLWSLVDEEMGFTSKTRPLVKPFYHRVIAVRSEQVHRLPMPDYEYEDLLPLIQQGRFAIFLYTCTTSDTAAGIESQGFFDTHNSPPWATWVYHVEPLPNFVEYIIVWIPPQFIDQANDGIEVCSDESILWFTDQRLDIPFADILKSAYLWI